jgi:hypothetical protein
MDGIGIWRRKVRDRVWLALALMLAVTPVAAADDDQDKYAPETVAAAERRLSSAGETLGAASLCKDIDRNRIRAAILKINELIDKGVDNNRQYYAGKNIFAKGIDTRNEAATRALDDFPAQRRCRQPEPLRAAGSPRPFVGDRRRMRGQLAESVTSGTAPWCRRIGCGHTKLSARCHPARAEIAE